MALSYFTESEAPRDFRISSTESEGHYTKCPLCYTVKKNFYCQDCIQTGNIAHSSMPYADRFSEKQVKLLRLKANRKHILDRCEKLLANKIKKDSLLTEAKQSRDKLDLLRLAIEQRRSNIEEKKKQLNELIQFNTELRLKLPRYQKRVSSLEKHAQVQRLELHARVSTQQDRAGELAALRRERVRHLHKYIFPVYISYDTSDSIEDMEFVGGAPEPEPEREPAARLHLAAPWLRADHDHSHALLWAKQNKEGALAAAECPADCPQHRTAAALALAAQLLALLAWTLDARLPHALTLSEYTSWRFSEAALARRCGRLGACAAALCLRAALPPPPAHAPPALDRAAPPAPQHAAPPPVLAALHAIANAASADDPNLGRVEAWTSDSLAAALQCWGSADAALLEPDPPEHLHWPDHEYPEASPSPPAAASPPAPAASLVSSALASVWRVWNK